MAHRLAEIVVPIGTMKGVVFVEKHDIGDIGQVVARARHGLRTDLQVDMIAACDCGGPASTGRDECPVNGHVTFVSRQALGTEIDIYPLVGSSNRR